VQDGAGVWHLGGELDADGVPQLSDRLTGVEGDVIFDCSELTFLASSGLSLFIATRQACQARGAQMVIVNPSRCVIRLLELTGLSALLDVPATRSAP
jgi:anti-anti-sigma factor